MNLPKLNTQYGAPMGRHTNAQDPGDVKVYVSRVRLDAGGYDSGGAYWGHGMPLYWAYTSDGSFSDFLRAFNRNDALNDLRDGHPHIKFARGCK